MIDVVAQDKNPSKQCEKVNISLSPGRELPALPLITAPCRSFSAHLHPI